MTISEQEKAGSGMLEGVPVIELVGSIAPESFGLGYAALNLAAALERAGANVFLGSVDREQVAREACERAGFPQDRLVRGKILVQPPKGRLGLRRS